MYTNEEENGERNSEGKANIFFCTDHSNQINLDNLSIDTNQNNQTPHRGNQGHELREFNCNYRQCENQINSTNRCGSLCQDGTCRDPNCRSYWNITLTPCPSNRDTVRRLSKENKVSPSDSRKSLESQKDNPSTSLPRRSDEKKIPAVNLFRTSDLEKSNSSTGIRKASSSSNITRTLEIETKFSGINILRTSDQEKTNSATGIRNANSSTNITRTSENETKFSGINILRTSDQEKTFSATGIRKANSSTNIARTSENETKFSGINILRTSDQEKTFSATGIRKANSSTNITRTSENETKFSGINILRTSDQEKTNSATGIRKANSSINLTSGNEKKISGVTISRPTDKEDKNSRFGSARNIPRTSDQEKRDFTARVWKAGTSTNLPKSSEKKIPVVNFSRTSDQKKTNTRGSPLNISRTSDQEKTHSATGIRKARTCGNEEKSSAEDFADDQKKTNLVTGFEKARISTNFPRTSENENKISGINISRTSDQEETNSATAIRKDLPGKALSLKESLIGVQQRRQEDNRTSCVRIKTEGTKRISPINLLRSTSSVNPSPSAMISAKSIDRLATINEENHPEHFIGVVPEIISHVKYSSVGSLIDYFDSIPSHGVQVQEIDIGQPCLGCESCKGYEAHSWRKNCRNCKCPRDNHAISEFAARSRIGFSASNDSLEPRTTGYTFVPSGLTKANQVAQYYSLFPSHEVPKIGSEGEVYRSQRLVKQLPKQDLSLTVCKFVETNQKGSFQDFIQARNEIALDIGYVKTASSAATCEYCEKMIPNGQYSIAAMKMGDLLWHPTCFRCSKCDDLLVDLAYCVYKDKIYCERHYAECLKPRCDGCDELIFSGEYTKAMNKDWHGQHFCCWQCDESLTGQRYVLRDDHPYCVSCYESVFANACEKCSRTIGIDSKDLSYKDKHWHEACFLCTTCGESLVDKQFGSKGERIYCGRCYDNQFASRCDGCNEIFRAGTKKMEYKTRQWHEKCFCCCVCKVPIGTQSFIPREQEIYCAKCYEEKFATRCIKCNKVITSGGVTYKNEPWHRECFTCTHCSKSLAGERFTSREEKPYCAECFGELFAKRCFACNKPITGIGGTKFISFEDRHWHNDCFFCAMCRSSLVGRGFITDQDDIICPECAKQKLL